MILIFFHYLLKILKTLNNSRISYQFIGFIKTLDLFPNNSFTGIKPFNFPYFQNEEIEECSNEIVVPNNLVMGKRMEHFFKAVISESSDKALIAYNIQLHENKTTLGELDFLIEDLTKNKMLHVELMYKFYVYDPDLATEMQRWIGPNRKDSLIEKLEKVKNHQLPLLHSSAAKQYLETLQISAEAIDQQICFKAKLFIPKRLEAYQFPVINNNCIVGYWYTVKQFNAEITEAYKFFAPEKQDWPSDPENNKTWITVTEINKEIQAMHLQKKSPLIWISKPTGVFESAIVVWW